MDKVLIIAGPTASGKTKISIELAKKINGEIISADSMQVYKYMNIGTAKPDEEERGGIKHYLIDEVNPDEEFSVAKYKDLAVKYIKEVINKGKMPIVVGGTGLYINSLVYNINFTETICDRELRSKLKKEAEVYGNKYIHDKLKEVDPEAAKRIHVNDTKRIIRAIEVYEHTKSPISYHQEVSRNEPPEFEFIITALRVDRAILYERINKRVDDMFAKGLIDEVKKLVSMGYGRNNTSMQAIGYKEILSYLEGNISLDEAIYIIKRDTRHYAKRQYTWFKRLEGIKWIDIDETTRVEDIVNLYECMLQQLA